MKSELTPKRAAELLVYEWLNGMIDHPVTLDAEDMTRFLLQYEYNVTNRRREQILEKVEDLISPLREKLAGSIQRFTNI